MQKLTEAYAFAAHLHGGQPMKAHPAEPFLTHLIDVAARVARSPAADEDLVVAAVLHDVIEKTPATAGQVAALFGAQIAAVVEEVTDDPRLTHEAQRQAQEDGAACLSDRAKRIKLADKASNLAALVESPPGEWQAGKLAAYLASAERVAEGCRGIDSVLETAFEAAAGAARAALEAENNAGKP